MTATTAELRPLLRRLKLGPMLNTLPERIALARRDGLDTPTSCRSSSPLSAQQSIDLYELVIGRRRSLSFVVTSNHAVEEWLGLFDDPILGNSALDRLANASYQIVIEGESYRQRLSPHRALIEGREGGD